jgi:phosphate uptake regulator
MKTRKVQLSGGTTYTVSLPKSWAEEHGIEQGSVLSLQQNNDGSLLVQAVSDQETPTRRLTLDVATADPNALDRRIRGLYAVGYDAATLVDETGHGAERRHLIESTIDDLSGLELLETTPTRVDLEMLIDAENVDIRKIALRLRLVALAMQRDAIAAVTEGDAALAERVVDRDREADKLFIMVTRYFRRALSDLQETEKLGQNRDLLFEQYYTCRQLERIADHAEKIANFVTDPEATFPTTLAEDVRRLGERTRTVIDAASDLILTDAVLTDAAAVMNDRNALVEDIERFDRELYSHDTPEEAYVAGLVLDSLQRTAEYGANIAQTGIEQALRRENLQ